MKIFKNKENMTQRLTSQELVEQSGNYLEALVLNTRTGNLV